MIITRDEVLGDLGSVCIFYTTFALLLAAVEPSWSIIDRLYFISATISTVGFGDVTTGSANGRLLTVCMIGIGLLLVWRLVDKYGAYFHQIYLIKLPESNASTDFERLIFALCPIIIVAFIAWLAVFIHMQLDFIDALYFVCVTMTTIGYGDHSPKSNHGRIALAFFLPFLLIMLAATTNELRRLDTKRLQYRRRTHHLSSPTQGESEHNKMHFAQSDEEDMNTTSSKEAQIVQALTRAGISDKRLFEELNSILLASDEGTIKTKRRRSSLDDISLNHFGSSATSPQSGISGIRKSSTRHFPSGSNTHRSTLFFFNAARSRLFLGLFLIGILSLTTLSDLNTMNAFDQSLPQVSEPQLKAPLSSNQPIRDKIIPSPLLSAASQDQDIRMEQHVTKQQAKQNQASAFLAASVTYDPPHADDDETPIISLHPFVETKPTNSNTALP